MIKLYNTLAREKQEFVPIEAGKVRIYVCGMTVYDFCHLGHARVMVVFDMITRWLRAAGYEVTYVRNITDIDDKIIKRAAENGETIRALTDRFITAMHQDADALGVIRPDYEPRATEYVPQMLDIIRKLEANGLAYKADNGDVCFAVRAFDGYGKLSGKSLEDLRAGERVDVADGKRDPLDFVLWKMSKAGESDEVKWDSPWGVGRPGWHIECSAMSSDLLGNHFDIHGGGQDLQFPHHENEIAQSEGALGLANASHKHDENCQHGFVNYWLHNGFVRVDNEKMSKSLGNFFTIREVLKKYDAEVIRFFILRANYRSPLNYSDAHLDDARQALTRLYTALKGFDGGGVVDWQNAYAQRFAEAMNDDFATAEAVAVLFDLAVEVNRNADPAQAALLKGLAGILDLLQRSPTEFLQAAPAAEDGLSNEAIEGLIQARIDAKKTKNFTDADRIRKELQEAGILLEDSAQGTTWRRA